MSGNLSFHFSLTIISYARHLTISLYQTTALGEYSFLKSKRIVDWSVENISAGPSWPWSNDSLIYNCLCNQCLSPLMLWVQISIRARCTTLCDQVCQWHATGQWFSPPIKHHQTNKQENISPDMTPNRMLLDCIDRKQKYNKHLILIILDCIYSVVAFSLLYLLEGKKPSN